MPKIIGNSSQYGNVGASDDSGNEVVVGRDDDGHFGLKLC